MGYILRSMLLGLFSTMSLYCLVPDTKPALPIYLVAWDMGGVTVDVSIPRMMRSIGALDCVHYHLGYTTGHDQLQNKIFDTLDRCCGKQIAPAYRTSYHTAHRPLPNIMCQWLDGSMPPTPELLMVMDPKIDTLYEQGFFINELEYRIIKNAIHNIFDSQTLIKNTYILADTLALIQKIHKKNICQQTVFSNWDLQSYPLLLASDIGTTLEEYISFETAIISGPLHLLKPDPQIFKKILQVWGMVPGNVLIVDDQPENLNIARRMGFQTMLVVNHDVRPVEQLLRSAGIID